MSSIKRSNMAPSELGQPKAPDKWDNKTTSSDVTTALDAGPQQREPPSKSTNASSQPDTKVKDSAANREDRPRKFNSCVAVVFLWSPRLSTSRIRWRHDEWDDPKCSVCVWPIPLPPSPLLSAITSGPSEQIVGAHR